MLSNVSWKTPSLTDLKVPLIVSESLGTLIDSITSSIPWPGEENFVEKAISPISVEKEYLIEEPDNAGIFNS